MSGLLDSVLGTVMQGDTVEKLANKLGMDKNQAQSALTSALPILMQAMNKKAATPEGASALENALPKDENGNIVDNVSGLLEQPNTAEEGGKIVNELLGDKKALVEQHISQDSGLSSDMVSGLLSNVAPMLMGFLGGQSNSTGGGIGSLLSGITGEMQSSGAGKDQNFIEKLLDQNNDGNVMDDVAKLGMSAMGKMFK